MQRGLDAGQHRNALLPGGGCAQSGSWHELSAKVASLDSLTPDFAHLLCLCSPAELRALPGMQHYVRQPLALTLTQPQPGRQPQPQSRCRRRTPLTSAAAGEQCSCVSMAPADRLACAHVRLCLLCCSLSWPTDALLPPLLQAASNPTAALSVLQQPAQGQGVGGQGLQGQGTPAGGTTATSVALPGAATTTGAPGAAVTTTTTVQTGAPAAGLGGAAGGARAAGAPSTLGFAPAASNGVQGSAQAQALANSGQAGAAVTASSTALSLSSLAGTAGAAAPSRPASGGGILSNNNASWGGVSGPGIGGTPANGNPAAGAAGGPAASATATAVSTPLPSGFNLSTLVNGTNMTVGAQGLGCW